MKESRDAFIMVCPTETLYKEHNKSIVERESAVAPYISIIGDILYPAAIFVDVENITYKFESLAKAIDICMKTYHLFSMRYSPAARIMWQFINKQFYGLKDDETIPAVHMLLKSIKGCFTCFY